MLDQLFAQTVVHTFFQCAVLWQGVMFTGFSPLLHGGFITLTADTGQLGTFAYCGVEGLCVAS